VRHPLAAAQIHLCLRGTATPDVRADPSPISYSDGGAAFAQRTPGAQRVSRGPTGHEVGRSSAMSRTSRGAIVPSMPRWS
jgi:hypothetical protein